MKPKDFQLATANRIFELFKNGQNRILLSDEVGLGKTIVAKTVIELLSKWLRKKHKKQFRVVYICSNANIANQNARALGIDNAIDVSESRLSMQHLRLSQGSGRNKEFELLIPLTPSTSFSMKGGYGNKNERALLFVLLRTLPEFKNRTNELNSFMKVEKIKRWKDLVNYYERAVEDCDKNGSNYLNKVKSYLTKTLKKKPNNDIIPSILKVFQQGPKSYNNKDSKGLINRIRKIFAEFSLQGLKPDLVIMDEFQRFGELVGKTTKSVSDSETNMLVKKFVKNRKMRILLLSATPYKQYNTLAELSEENVEKSYEDFFFLMNYLHPGKEFDQFKSTWLEFSKSLIRVDLSSLKKNKKKAEDELYKVMCRTERKNIEIIDDSKVVEVPINVADILSYNQLKLILDKSYMKDLKKKVKNRAYSYKVPVEYIKSCPFILSYADNYELKKHLFEVSFKKKENELLDVVKKERQYILTKSNVENYKQLETNNARFEYLKNLLFNKTHTERLLWVPASHPYYKNVGGVFDDNKDFSKILIFSSYEVVPRMLATLLSYENERRLKKQIGSFAGKKGAKHLQNKYERDIIKFVSPKLASFYKPKKYYGKNLAYVKAEVCTKVGECLKKVAKKFGLALNGKASAKGIYELLYLIDEKNPSNLPKIKAIPKNAEEVLTNIAIASPASCFYRIFKSGTISDLEKEKSPEQYALKCAQEFITMFSRRENAAALYSEYNKKNKPYYSLILDYCVKGNLQAVLDEYAFMLSSEGDQLQKDFIEGFFGGDSFFYIDACVGVGKKSIRTRVRMRTHYALSYAKATQANDEVKRNINVQKVFNSPFRPFVLASTSIGQEGLDFHKYARKIMHWNLPANPVEMEQREGRINRYMNLSIRRNISHMYEGVYSWEEMLKKAAKKYQGHDCEMVPYWYLPPKMIADMEKKHLPIEKIERIVAMYPMSRDCAQYERLMQVLSLYRLTIGQCDQEELIDQLKGKLSKKEIDKLIMNLSPIRKLSKRQIDQLIRNWRHIRNNGEIH